MSDILVINSGSSSLKFAVFRASANTDLAGLIPLYRGHFSGLDAQSHIRIENQAGENVYDSAQPDTRLAHQQALTILLKWLDAQSDTDEIAAIGHRIVHGGRHYQAPVRLDQPTLQALKALIPLAPLHQPHGLAPVELLSQLRPQAIQVACFDTSFHAHQPDVARNFALPAELTDAGIVRYGFHGLSYEYVTHSLRQQLKTSTGGKFIIAHLGNGASLCAVKDGVSIASTMGFTALDGLPMGTRCGNIDPGVILHLQDRWGMSLAEINELLYKRSGLLGVSGISSDMRALLESTDASAKAAIALFVYRIVREIGSLVAALGGLDQLVFTAGIGERAAPVRRDICKGCQWLGVEIDLQQNASHALNISGSTSQVGVWVIPTDEERMMAWHTLNIYREAATI